MKEYKVEIPKLGLTKRQEKFQDFLNQYAREGWIVKDIGQNWSSVVFERNKNR
ncbi:hypothetical protein [Tenacibaculum insulae]|uniref:hypothetical protein n=1 Tax=Tenacibaculum insulae TaxID=2029677 RepID=UPI003AB3AABC